MRTQDVARIINEHYGRPRMAPITIDEVTAEFDNLKRKARKGTLDTRDEALATRLEINWPALYVPATHTEGGA